jgi:hypothetical protein
MSVQNIENDDHIAALKIQNWWRNLYRNYDSSDTDSSSDSSDTDSSETDSDIDSDIYPRTHHNYQEIKEIPEIQEKNFCNSLLAVFVEVSIVILLPIVYFRAKNYFV